MDLSIIIVNWNSVKYLERCLESIYKHTEKIAFEVIVVDNASYDGSDELIQRSFADVKFIQSSENIGFAQANNLGSKSSSGRYLLFLNPDTEIIGPAINTMYSALQTIPDAGAVGCKLLNSDMTLDTSCVQPFPTVLNQALDIEYLKRRFPGMKLWRSNPIFADQENPVAVEVIIGACIMIKGNLFEKIGAFSQGYFMYAEDLDLCYKVRKAGSKTYYISEAEIIHHGGGSTKNKQKSDFKTIMMRESVLRFMKKTKGSPYAYLYRLVMSVAALCRLVLILCMSPLSICFKKTYDTKSSFSKWKKILRWSVGMENWTKEYFKYVPN